MTRETLLNHLERDEIEAVLAGLEQQLLSRGDDALQQQYNTISARYHKNRDLELEGTEDRDAINREYNRIRKALFHLIGQAFAEKKTSTAGPARAFVAKWRWPLLVFGIALLLFSIALLPARQFAFCATLKCSSLEVRLPEGWPDGHYVPANNIYLSGVEKTRDEQGQSWNPQRDGGEPVLGVASGTIRLEGSGSQGPQTLSLSANSGILTLSLRDGCSGYITADSAGSDATAYTQWSLIPGGSISFQPRNTTDFDAVDRLPFDSIAFLAREPDSEQLESTIQSGEINIIGKKEPLALHAKDFLVLEGVSQGDITVRLGEDSSLEVRIQGKARAGRSGLRPPLASIKPSLLEKFYYDQRVVFLLTTLSSLIAFLWTLLNALGLLHRKS